MSLLIDILADALAYFGWRVWTCFFVALLVASLLAAFDIAFVWRYDLAAFAVFLGIGTGLFWEGRSEEVHQRRETDRSSESEAHPNA